jgi:hypothetical protein
MNREELLLELDGRNRVFRPGEPITGRVRVGATTRSGGRPLVVVRWWETTREGDVERGDEEVVELAAGDASIGGQTFPFSFPAAIGPLSYAGTTFSLEWRVEARLGRSRGSTPNWQGIVIEADPAEPVRGVPAMQLFWLTNSNVSPPRNATAVLPREYVSGLLEDKETFARRAQPTQIGCLTFFIVSCFLGFVMIPITMITDWLGAEELVSRYASTGFYVIVGVVIVALLVLLVIERRLEHNLGLTIRLADRLVRPGDDLVCTIGVHPVRARTIAGAEVRVTAQESSTSSGVDSVGDTRRVMLFDSTVVASPPRALRADTSEQFTVRIPLPRDAAATFESRYHGVEWKTQVSIRLGPRTSIDRTLGFLVYPNGAAYWRRQDA